MDKIHLYSTVSKTIQKFTTLFVFIAACYFSVTSTARNVLVENCVGASLNQNSQIFRNTLNESSAATLYRSTTNNYQLNLATNIPDANFAAAISAACPTCIDLSTRDLLPPAASLTSLNVQFTGGIPQILSLAGVDGFTSLTDFNCGGNALSDFPTFPSSLLHLVCVGNTSSLSISSLPSNLTSLSCYSSHIYSLPNLPSSLTVLDCHDNVLTSLPANLSSSNLTTLNCENNGITSVSGLPNSLQYLTIQGNSTLLISLPVIPSGMLGLVLSPEHITCLQNIPSGLTIYKFDGGYSVITLPLCSTLPLNWLDFQAKLTGSDKKVILNWVTASETNVKSFEVQRSNDGILFQTLSEELVANNSITVNNYQYSDELPLKGVSYYRVKELDLNDKSSFSGIRSINNTASKSDLSVFPNPAKNDTWIDLSAFAGKEVTISITDLTGKILQSKTIEEVSFSLQQIDVSNFANGLYFIKIQPVANEILTKKLLVSN